MDFRDSFNSQTIANRVRRDTNDKKCPVVQSPRAPRAPMSYRLPTVETYRRPLWF